MSVAVEVALHCFGLPMGDMTRPHHDWAQELYPPRQGSDGRSLLGADLAGNRSNHSYSGSGNGNGNGSGNGSGDNVYAYPRADPRVAASTKRRGNVQLPGLSSLLSSDTTSIRDFSAATPSSSTLAANIYRNTPLYSSAGSAPSYSTASAPRGQPSPYYGGGVGASSSDSYAAPSPARQMPPQLLSSDKVYGGLSGPTDVPAPMSSSCPRLSPAAQSFASSDWSSRHHSRDMPAYYHPPAVAAGYPVTSNDRPALASASPYPETRNMSITGLLSDAPRPMMPQNRPLEMAPIPTERKAVAPVAPQMPPSSRYKNIQARPPVQQQQRHQQQQLQQQPRQAHDARRAPPSIIPTTRTRGPVRESEYRIWVRQQPVAARSCGFGERDRRVIDPPPIVQMSIDMPGATREEIRMRMRFQFAVLHCSIWDETGELDSSAMPEDYRQQRRLMGTLVSSPFVGEDEHGEEGCFFCFSDLSCRTPGAFRLKFALVVLNPQNMRAGGSSPILATAMSGVFIVYNAKDFPGMQASTALTKRLKEQGCLISIKKGNDKTSAAHDCESDDDDDDSHDDRPSGKSCKRPRRM